MAWLVHTTGCTSRKTCVQLPVLACYDPTRIRSTSTLSVEQLFSEQHHTWAAVRSTHPAIVLFEYVPRLIPSFNSPYYY